MAADTCENHVTAPIDQYELALKRASDNKKTPAMGKKVYNALTAAYDAVGMNQQNKALELLDKISDEKISSYETVQIENYYAYVYFSMDNYPRAIEAYNNLLSNRALPVETGTQTLYTLAQMNILEEHYCDGIKIAKLFLKVTGETGKDKYAKSRANTNKLIAQAYYSLDDYTNSNLYIDKAIQLKQKAGETISESLYQMEYLNYFELNDMEKAIESLESMKTNYPRSEMLIHLAWAYDKVGRHEDSEAMLDYLVKNDIVDKNSYVVTLADIMRKNNQAKEACNLLREKFGKDAKSKLSKDSDLYAECYLIQS